MMRPVLAGLVALGLIALAHAQGLDAWTALALKQRLGSTSNSGHTNNAVTMTFPSIAIGGTSITVTGLADAASGYQPAAGAWCGLASSTAAPLPANMILSCTFSATPGTATITAFPIGGLSLGAQSFAANIFWNW